MAVIKLPSLVKMTNLTLCPWGSKSRKTANLAKMELCFTEKMSMNQRQAVFQVYQCMHQWTQQCIHPLMAKADIAFPFPTSVRLGLNSLRQEALNSLLTEEQVNNVRYRSCIGVILVKATQQMIFCSRRFRLRSSTQSGMNDPDYSVYA